MQPAPAALPEFDCVETDRPPAPAPGTRDVDSLEALVDLHDTLFEFCAIRQHRALR